MLEVYPLTEKTIRPWLDRSGQRMTAGSKRHDDLPPSDDARNRWFAEIDFEPVAIDLGR